MSGSIQTKHTHTNSMPSSPTHSLVLMLANESHYLCISMLLCTGGLVWELLAVCGWNSISVYHSHTPVFGLVLSLASAESPVWVYLTADCGEHRVFCPAPPCPYSHWYRFCSLAQPVLRRKHMSHFRKHLWPVKQKINTGALTQYSHCDDNFLMG